MKKTLIGMGLGALLALGAFALPIAHGQAPPAGEEYMMVMAIKPLLGKKVTITLDYGQETGPFQDERLRAADGKVSKFNSVMDALNHLSETGGWEFQNAYAITVGNQNVYHYVMARPRGT